MKNKAVVVGGSSGVGLVAASLMVDQGWKVIIVDKTPPLNESLEQSDDIEYKYCDLLEYDKNLFGAFSNEDDVKCLLITAGIGKVCSFEYLHISEIENTVTVNTTATLKIINQFYSRINSDNDFYCGIISSIAGHVSSPLFATYAATKAALSRFIESVNIELEYKGLTNRILDISPGNIKGTRFYGADGIDEDSILPIAEDILASLKNKDTLLIPDYDKTYKSVLNRYKMNPHKFGLQSMEYKQDSGRAVEHHTARVGYLSGTFDLFHIGHLNLLKRAKRSCDYLVVGVHSSGAWKGKETFIPLNERKEILKALRFVDEVIDAPDEDSDAWNLVKYNYLFVGSDYRGTERFERYEKVLGKKGVKIIYFPYTTTTSSTQLRQAIRDVANNKV